MYDTSNQFCSRGATIIYLKHGLFVFQLLEILQIVRKYDNLCIWGHYFRGALFSFFLHIIFGLPNVIPLHGTFFSNSTIKQFIYFFIIHFASIVIYNSQYTANSYKFKGNYFIVYNGLLYDMIPLKTSFSPQLTVNLLSISGLTKSKNILILLKMMCLLPTNFSLTIIGDGPERQSLENAIADLGLSNNVFLPGYVPNASHEIYKADIFLHPSIDESFGMVVAEALFARVPVVVTNTCATYEIIGKGSFGWSSNALDPRSWARTVNFILSNPKIAWNKSLDGRKWALERFSSKSFAHRIDSIVSSLSKP